MLTLLPSYPLSTLIMAVVAAIYPLLVYFSLIHLEARYIGLVLLLVIAARFAMSAEAKQGKALLMAIIGGSLAVLVLASNQVIFLKLYPVCMSALAFAIFYHSLLHPPTVIERIARRSFSGEMPENVVHYVRNVTKLWCGFFVVNGSIALYTAVAASMEMWTFYNGLLSYVLMGILFAGEYIYRRYKQRQEQKHG